MKEPNKHRGQKIQMNKPSIKEIIVVEGRDDTIAIKRAVDALTIETHGFGIRPETIEIIKKAYEEKGIIIFTDPDHAGETIRKKLLEKFPNAKEAFLDRKSAEKKGDIGIENAEPEAIVEALSKAKCTERKSGFDLYSEEDIFRAGLTGRADSKHRREELGKKLGIGYGNAKTILAKLNKFEISTEEFNEAISAIDN